MGKGKRPWGLSYNITVHQARLTCSKTHHCYQFERLTRFFAKKTVFFTKKGYHAPINFERYIVRSWVQCHGILGFCGITFLFWCQSSRLICYSQVRER